MLLTVKQAAARLSISETHCYDLIGSEALAAVDVRHPGAQKAAYRVTEQSVADFVEKRTVRKHPTTRRTKRDYPRLA